MRPFLSVLLILGCHICSWVASAQQYEQEGAVFEAVKLYDLGKTDEALMQLWSLVMAPPVLERKDHLVVALNTLATIRYERGEYAQALQDYQEAHQIASIEGFSRAIPVLENNIASVQFCMGNYTDAQRLYHEALQSLERDSVDRKVTLTNLIMVQTHLGNHDSAARMTRELPVEMDQLSEEVQAHLYTNQGNLAYRRGDYGQAEKCYDRARDIYREMTRDALAFDLPLRINLTNLEYARGHYDLAVEGYLKIKEELEKWRGTNFRFYQASILHRLANAERGLADYATAGNHYGQAVRIWQDLGMEGEWALAEQDYGELEYRRGRYTQAEKHYQRALELSSGSHSRIRRANIFCSMACLASHYGNYEEALQIYQEGRNLYEQLGLIRQEVLTSRAIAEAHAALGNNETAEALLRQAMEVAKTEELSQQILDVLEASLADVLMEQGQLQEARSLLQRDPLRLGRYCLKIEDFPQALQEFKRVLGSRDVSTQIAGYIGIGLAEEGRGNCREAEKAYQEAVNRIEDQRKAVPLDSSVYFLSAKQHMFPRIEAYEGLVRSLALQGKWNEAFGQSQLTRARLFLDSISWRDWSRFPKGFDAARRAAVLKRRLSLALLRGIDPTDLADLEKQRQAAEQELLRDPDFAALFRPGWPEPDKLGLRHDEALIAFEVTHDRTFLFVVKPGQPLRGFTLNLTRSMLEIKIEQYCAPFREVDDETQTRPFRDLNLALGRELYELLLAPALDLIEEQESLLERIPLIRNRHAILVIPDEQLSALPFEALIMTQPSQTEWREGKVSHEGAVGSSGPFPEGVQYVGDVYHLSYWQSANTLAIVRETQRKAIPKDRLLVVTNPILRHGDSKVALAAAEAEVGAQRSRTSTFSSQKPTLWDELAPLEGLTSFAEELSDRLRPHQLALRILEGRHASEGALRACLLEAGAMPTGSVPSDQYGFGIIFATHGVLVPLGGASEGTRLARGQSTRSLDGLKQPSLVLANPRAVETSPEPSPARDGILTANEVIGLPFGTEIVATLACETDRGGYLFGEGVMNFSRAFQYAGARSVLTSLWKVDDLSTNQLAESFFENLAEGMRKDEALFLARKQIRASGYQHPYYWAAFILIGERNAIGKTAVWPPLCLIALGLICVVGWITLSKR